MSAFPLPPDLPAPTDDGACDHLLGARLPPVALPATTGEDLDLSALAGWVVVYVYPATGTPGVPLPQGWNAIPGARGCTPQSCAFRDLHAELRSLGAAIFGLSAQTPEAQREAAARLELPFPLLSDRAFAFAGALALPAFEAEGERYLKRATLVARDAVVEKVFYPVFPPDRNAADVLDWLRERPLRRRV